MTDDTPAMFLPTFIEAKINEILQNPQSNYGTNYGTRQLSPDGHSRPITSGMTRSGSEPNLLDPVSSNRTQDRIVNNPPPLRNAGSVPDLEHHGEPPPLPPERGKMPPLHGSKTSESSDVVALSSCYDTPTTKHLAPPSKHANNAPVDTGTFYDTPPMKQNNKNESAGGTADVFYDAPPTKKGNNVAQECGTCYDTPPTKRQSTPSDTFYDTPPTKHGQASSADESYYNTPASSGGAVSDESYYNTPPSRSELKTDSCYDVPPVSDHQTTKRRSVKVYKNSAGVRRISKLHDDVPDQTYDVPPPGGNDEDNTYNVPRGHNERQSVDQTYDIPPPGSSHPGTHRQSENTQSVLTDQTYDIPASKVPPIPMKQHPPAPPKPPRPAQVDEHGAHGNVLKAATPPKATVRPATKMHGDLGGAVCGFIVAEKNLSDVQSPAVAAASSTSVTAGSSKDDKQNTAVNAKEDTLTDLPATSTLTKGILCS